MEEALRDKAVILQSLEKHADKLKAESPEDVGKQIDESVVNIRSDWKCVEDRLNRVQISYHQARDCWSLLLRLKTEISEWIRPIYPHVVQLESKSGSIDVRKADESSGREGESGVDLVKRLQHELPIYEAKMSELDQAAKELCVTLFYQNQKNGGALPDEQMIPTGKSEQFSAVISGDGETGGVPILQVQAFANGKQAQLPITIELEALNRKLLFLRNFLSAVADNQQGVGGKGAGQSDDLLEQAKATFSSVCAVSYALILRTCK